MGDERPGGSGGGGLGLRDVLDMLRDDGAAAEGRAQRLLDDMERRVMGAIADVRSDLGKYVDSHAGDHRALRTSEEVAHAKYDAFLAANAIDQARRDGALGMVRYTVELLSRNWHVVALAVAGVAAATGAVHINVGVGT